MTSSVKPDVHNISQHRQRRTEPRPRATCKNLVKFGLTVFELCERTDRQTNRCTDYLKYSATLTERNNDRKINGLLKNASIWLLYSYLILLNCNELCVYSFGHSGCVTEARRPSPYRMPITVK